MRKEKVMIRDEDEIQLYHLICDISRVCKEYFYDRKYLPNDAWKMLLSQFIKHQKN